MNLSILGYSKYRNSCLKNNVHRYQVNVGLGYQVHGCLDVDLPRVGKIITPYKHKYATSIIIIGTFPCEGWRRNLIDEANFLTFDDGAEAHVVRGGAVVLISLKRSPMQAVEGSG